MSQAGDTLKRLREEQNLTVNQISQKMGIPPSRLYEIEQGIRLATESQLARLETYFSLDAGALSESSQ